MVFQEPRNLACSLYIILYNAISILIVRNRLYRFCRLLSIPSFPSFYPLAFYFPLLLKPSPGIQKPKKRYQFSLARRNFCRMPSTTLSYSRIPRVYIIPAIYVLYPACISSTLSSQILLSRSSLLYRNRPSPFRKYLRLIAILIFRYDYNVNPSPNAYSLTYFISRLIRTGVYLRSRASIYYIFYYYRYYPLLPISYNISYAGRTNYIFYIIKVSTSYSKTRQITFTSLLILYPLQYCVTIST